MTHAHDVWAIAGPDGKIFIPTVAGTRSEAWRRLLVDIIGEPNTPTNRARHRRHGDRAVRAVLHKHNARCRL